MSLNKLRNMILVGLSVGGALVMSACQEFTRDITMPDAILVEGSRAGKEGEDMSRCSFGIAGIPPRSEVSIFGKVGEGPNNVFNGNGIADNKGDVVIGLNLDVNADCPEINAVHSILRDIEQGGDVGAGYVCSRIEGTFNSFSCERQ